jgi:hypothetical protein
MTHQSDTTNLPAVTDPTAPMAAPISLGSGDQFEILFDIQKFEHMQRIATIFSKSGLVPKQFQNNMPACFVAMEMAVRLKTNPFMLMQSIYEVHNRPGIEAKLAISLANARGVFEGPIEYDLTGKGMARGCVASAVMRRSGKRVEMRVTMEMAKAEGWIDKAGSKWKTIPDLMLQYRSAAWLIRLHAPEVLMGLQTVDELVDISKARSVSINEAMNNLAEKQYQIEQPAEVVKPEVVTPEPAKPETTTPANPAEDEAKSDDKPAAKIETKPEEPASEPPTPPADPAPPASTPDADNAAQEKLAALMREHKVSVGIARVYIAKALGGSKPIEDLTSEEAARVYDVIAKTKGVK